MKTDKPSAASAPHNSKRHLEIMDLAEDANIPLAKARKLFMEHGNTARVLTALQELQGSSTQPNTEKSRI